MSSETTENGPDNPSLALVERIVAEKPIGVMQASRLLGTFGLGKPCNPGTVARWIMAGVKMPDGSVLKLEAIRAGSRLMTSKPAVLRFLSRQQGTPTPTGTTPAPRSPAARQRDSEAAAAQLTAIGA